MASCVPAKSSRIGSLNAGYKRIISHSSLTRMSIVVSLAEEVQVLIVSMSGTTRKVNRSTGGRSIRSRSFVCAKGYVSDCSVRVGVLPKSGGCCWLLCMGRELRWGCRGFFLKRKLFLIWFFRRIVVLESLPHAFLKVWHVRHSWFRTRYWTLTRCRKRRRF